MKHQTQAFGHPMSPGQGHKVASSDTIWKALTPKERAYHYTLYRLTVKGKVKSLETGVFTAAKTKGINCQPQTPTTDK